MEPEQLQAILEAVRPAASRLMRRYRGLRYGPEHTASLIQRSYEKAVRGLQGTDDPEHARRLLLVAMKHVLIDCVRRQDAEARNLGARRLLEGLDVADDRSVPEGDLDLLATEMARLEQRDPKLAEIVVLRGLMGCTWPEVAEAVELASSTVREKYKAWIQFLRLRYGEDHGGGSEPGGT